MPSVGVSPSWLYKWKSASTAEGGAPGKAEVKISRLFCCHQGTYGAPRITAELRDAGSTLVVAAQPVLHPLT
jgi:hypothetical protein